MFTLRVKGKDRSAEFEIDREANTICCTDMNYQVSDDASQFRLPYGDCLEVICKEKGRRNMVDDQWVVLYGTFSGIIRIVNKDLPMAKMESDAIFAFFDLKRSEDPEAQNKPHLLVYYLSKPSPVIGRTVIHREMRKNIKSVVAHLYGVSTDTVQLLPLHLADPPFTE